MRVISSFLAIGILSAGTLHAQDPSSPVMRIVPKAAATGPNLTPYKPSGWSDKIVVSTSDCSASQTCTDSPNIQATDLVYISKAIDNSGTATCPIMNRAYNMYLDGVILSHGALTVPLPAHYWNSWGSSATGPLSVGTHTLMIQVDPDNEVAETDETDNSYTRTFVVGTCGQPSAGLCLGGRFLVTVNWSTTDGRSGQGTPVTLTGDTGYFWFFNSANVELVVKVLDGTALNGHFWVFYGALSNVAYTITVFDTQTQTTRTYTNLNGQMASYADTSAFAAP
jgi:hypothetical protein